MGSILPQVPQAEAQNDVMGVDTSVAAVRMGATTVKMEGAPVSVVTIPGATHRDARAPGTATKATSITTVLDPVITINSPMCSTPVAIKMPRPQLRSRPRLLRLLTLLLPAPVLADPRRRK
jgi:hypothetical protein